MTERTSRPLRPRGAPDPAPAPEPPTPQEEAAWRNAKLDAVARSREEFRAHTQRAVARLGELLEHEDPQVVIAAARELLHAQWRPGATGERVTADDVEHERERRRLRPRIWKGGQEALEG